ncbi:zinc finger domain-containing protein [Nonomuraea polychroma]|uniref:zinc finger domain-containing protein n=1 Tax=Nonomuraea polychroma TaxID=46176 RepID=UPI003D89CB87
MIDQTNPLAVAQEIASFVYHLECMASQDDYVGVTASSLHTLIKALQQGRDALTATVDAMRVFDEKHAEIRRSWDVQAQKRDAAHQRLMAEEEITRKVECPYCGAVPQLGCRTVGPRRALRAESHRDRYRLARGLEPEASGRGGSGTPLELGDHG